jgi:uncharacterized membrane protein YhiD involved in acid resistance
MAWTASEILTGILSAIVLCGVVSGFDEQYRRPAGVRTAIDLLEGKNRRTCATVATVMAISVRWAPDCSMYEAYAPAQSRAH